MGDIKSFYLAHLVFPASKSFWFPGGAVQYGSVCKQHHNLDWTSCVIGPFPRREHQNFFISFSQHSACQVLADRRRSTLPFLPAMPYTTTSTNFSPAPRPYSAPLSVSSHFYRQILPQPHHLTLFLQSHRPLSPSSIRRGKQKGYIMQKNGVPTEASSALEEKVNAQPKVERTGLRLAPN